MLFRSHTINLFNTLEHKHHLTIGLETGRNPNTEDLSLVISYDGKAVTTPFDTDMEDKTIFKLLIDVIATNHLFGNIPTGELIEAIDEIIKMGAMLLR